MEEDKFALVEKIIKDIENVLSKNAELYAFDIVPVDSNFRNKTPVLHLENCLGLESWCVKHVYMYCYSELMDKYFCKTKRRNSTLGSIHSEKLGRLLSVTLLLNPELNTLWNKRRDMVLRNLLEKSSELKLTRLVLSRKPKCNEAFGYRRWLLEAILQDENLQSNYIQNLVNEEFHLCQIASDKSPNNYHSWNHRMWLLNTLKKITNFSLDLLYIKEYNFSERWTSKHVSDFSCFHYRQYCIKNVILHLNDVFWKMFQNSIEIDLRKCFVNVLLKALQNDMTLLNADDNLMEYSEEKLINLLLSNTRNCNCKHNNVYLCRKFEVLFRELVLNSELIQFYKWHESLWYHRRYIVHELIISMYEYFGLKKQNGALVKDNCKKCNSNDLRQKQVKIVRYDCNRVYSSAIFKVLISHERKFIAERNSDSDKFAERHEKYLKFVEGLNIVI